MVKEGTELTCWWGHSNGCGGDQQWVQVAEVAEWLEVCVIDLSSVCCYAGPQGRHRCGEEEHPEWDLQEALPEQ